MNQIAAEFDSFWNEHDFDEKDKDFAWQVWQAAWIAGRNQAEEDAGR